METPGAKGILRDLERLKKLLQPGSIGGESVKELCVKLGKARVAMADKAATKNGEKAKELGEAL